MPPQSNFHCFIRFTFFSVSYRLRVRKYFVLLQTIFKGNLFNSRLWQKLTRPQNQIRRHGLIQIVRDKHFASQGCVASTLRQCFRFNVAHQKKNTHMIKAVIPLSSQCAMLSVDLYVSLFILCYMHYQTGTSPMTSNAYCMPHELMTQVFKPDWPTCSALWCRCLFL